MKVTLILNALAFTILDSTRKAAVTITVDNETACKSKCIIEESDASQKTNTLAYIEDNVRPILREACEYAGKSAIDVTPEEIEVVIVQAH